MASPSENLARSLEALKQLQDDGVIAIQTSQLSRINRERLLDNGFIQEVMKGWYIAASPADRKGDSTPWYSAFWPFCSQYLEQRFGHDWNLSPEQSLLLHAGNNSVPQQLMVRSSKASNNVTQLLHGTSLVDASTKSENKSILDSVSSLNLYSLPASLVMSGPAIFRQSPIDARVALSQIRDASDVLALLLPEGKSVVAGRLAGGFQNIGRNDIANEISSTFKIAGTTINIIDPFDEQSPILSNGRSESPYSTRIKMMWESMRGTVLDVFGEAETAVDKEAYLSRIDDIYATDAYHSLSIEGYIVSQDLIDKVRNNNWKPEDNNNDRDDRNALAARGYWEAFSRVKQSIEAVFDGADPGDTVKADLTMWYRALFAPSVKAGILDDLDLAGYRSIQVYIRGAKHTPMSKDAVRDAMPTLFELLHNEGNPSVRAVLGHFTLVYIHPFMDGNGRTARFLMNVMFASGGQEWKVIPVERRDEYMASLEAASTDLDIRSFAEFIHSIKYKPEL